MRPTKLYPSITCSLCGKTGNWPMLPFLDSGEHVSARPSDFAALVVMDDIQDPDAHLCPSSLKANGTAFDAFCPDCYRMADSVEGNGLHLNIMQGVNGDTLNDELFRIFNRDHVSANMLEEAFKDVFVSNGPVGGVAFNSSTGGDLHAVFTLQTKSSQRYQLDFRIQALTTENDKTAAIHSVRLLADDRTSIKDAKEISIFSAAIPDEFRSTILVPIYRIYHSLFLKFKKIAKDEKKSIKEAKAEIKFTKELYQKLFEEAQKHSTYDDDDDYNYAEDYLYSSPWRTMIGNSRPKW